MPVDVVLTAGLHVGLELDRERLRVLRRELRAREALTKASRLLAHRDLSESGLGEELKRRRVAPAARRETISRLVDVGAVDDERLAQRRAELLAARGAGDALIRADLEARGIDRGLIDRAIDALDDEGERARAIVAARGPGPATARYLARKGFDDDAVAAADDGYVAETG